MPRDANRSLDARFQRSSSALREALLRVLDRAELAHVTVQMIVKEAGIGYATFFRHHPSLESLLLAVADAMIGDVAARIFPDLVKGNQEGALAEFVLYVEQNRRAIRALLVGGGDRIRREIVVRATAQAGVLPFQIDPTLPPELAIRHLVAAGMEVIVWHLDREPGRAGPSKVLDDLSQLLRRLALAPVIVPLH
jgi:AcrR family transcriptional regulator